MHISYTESWSTNVVSVLTGCRFLTNLSLCHRCQDSRHESIAVTSRVDVVDRACDQWVQLAVLFTRAASSRVNKAMNDVFVWFCLSVCPHDKTKTAETKFIELGTGIIHHDTSPVNEYSAKRSKVTRPQSVKRRSWPAWVMHSIECQSSLTIMEHIHSCLTDISKWTHRCGWKSTGRWRKRWCLSSKNWV